MSAHEIQIVNETITRLDAERLQLREQLRNAQAQIVSLTRERDSWRRDAMEATEHGRMSRTQILLEEESL